MIAFNKYLLPYLINITELMFTVTENKENDVNKSENLGKDIKDSEEKQEEKVELKNEISTEKQS